MLYKDRIQLQIERLEQVPEPDDAAIDHSELLYQKIVAQINQRPFSFSEFMHQLLYAPGLGYYSAGSTKIGPAGDFITAPELSPLFGHCLAVQAQQVLGDGCADMLEFGAGTGRLAVAIMSYLAAVDDLPDHYFILEPSPDLQQRQQDLIKTECPEQMERFVWITELPETFAGVIIANEVLDAMPVNIFKVADDGIEEMQVAVSEAGELHPQFTTDISPELADWWVTTGRNLGLPNEYESEVNLAVNPWIESLANCLTKGLIILIDYGFPMSEYYLPERSTGTLKCHYRHRHHNDPFVLLGLQDVTAHVDFTAVAEAGFESGLDVLGYVNQAGFLTSCGILQMAENELPVQVEASEDSGLKQQLLLSQQIKPLIMPEEMGELFKVIALGKDIDSVDLGGLIGFRYLDQRRLL